MAIIGDKNIKELIGKVISNKTDKTLTVAVDRVKMHALYKKRFTVSKKYCVHDEENKAAEGDTVKIRATKPMSKTKRWVLIDIIEKAAA